MFKYLVDIDLTVLRYIVRAQHPVNQISQTVCFVDDDLGVFLEFVLFQFAFE